MGDPHVRFDIGEDNWARNLRAFTDTFDREFWDRWKTTTEAELNACEEQTGRQLPQDFRQFLLVLGFGPFPNAGGSIDSPEDIAAGSPAALWFVLGSTTWASDEEHRKFYRTRGTFNPVPERFTHESLSFQGHSLLDLLQIGSDGSGCYHHLYVGPDPKPFGYCLLTPEATEEDKLPSFSAALWQMLLRERRSAVGLDQSAEATFATDFVVDEDG